MSRCLSLLVVLSITTTLHSQGEPPAKKSEKYVSEKGRFAVKFPGRVRTLEQQADTAFGKITTYVTSTAIGQNISFLVVYSDLPAAAKSDTTALIDNIKITSKGADGVIVRDEGLSFGPDKLLGRKIVVRKEGSILRNTMILKGDRVYQIIIVSPNGMFGDPRAEEFISSFEITK